MSADESLWKPVHTVELSPAATTVDLSENSTLTIDGEPGGSSTIVDWGLQRSWKLGDGSRSAGGTGCATACVDNVVVVAGGKHSLSTTVESVVETSLLNSGVWVTNKNSMASPRWFPSVIGVPSQHSIIVAGGKSNDALLDTVEVCLVRKSVSNEVSLDWSVLPTPLPAGPIMGAAATACKLKDDKTAAFIMGGYNGKRWVKDCHWYEFQNGAGSLEGGIWKESGPHSLMDAVRFGKAVSVPYKDSGLTEFVIVVGESCTMQGQTSIQCFDVATQTWLWHQHCPLLITVDALSLVENRLFAIGKSANTSGYGAFTCDLATLDPQRFVDCSALTSSFTTPAPVLRNVRAVKLQGGLSLYTGQMTKQVGGSWIPHGEGLEVWADAKKQFWPLHEKENSYYRGFYNQGYRDGMGEMFLLDEGQLYTGQFKNGSWHGIGRLEIKAKGFCYFGTFDAGERSGFGRCSFRAPDSPKPLVYSGYWSKGLAQGEGTVADLADGVVVECRTFNGEDLVG